MSEGAELDVLGIGNAIVNVLAHCDDAFLDAEGLVKGSMNLIEVEQSKALYSRMGAAVEVSGGAAANSMAGDRLVRRPGRLHREDPRRHGGRGVRPRHPRGRASTSRPRSPPTARPPR